MLVDAPALHKKLAIEAGVGHLIERQGLMHIYPSRAAFDADRPGWNIRKRVGVTWLELSSDEMRQREPDLHPRYQFGVLVEEAGRCRDPGGYVAALAEHARTLGAEFVNAHAKGLRLANGRLMSVVTDHGEIACDAALIAAGARSKPLAASIGDRLPLETERGYHVMIEHADSGPRASMMASDAKMVVNWTDKEPARGRPCRDRRARRGAELETRRDPARSFDRHVPEIAQDLPADRFRFWFGHRPSMPDGLACLGYSRASRDVVYAFGHGHIGLVSSARTGRVVAQLVGGREPKVPVAPFDPKRYL